MTLPIPIAMAVAVYFTMWWTVLFAVLPFGVKSQDEGGVVIPGTEPGAPQSPLLLKKAIWTTLLSGILFVALMLIMAYFPDGLPQAFTAADFRMKHPLIRH